MTRFNFAREIIQTKANPMKIATRTHDEAVAALNRNAPAFYCVPAAEYEALIDKLGDLELLKIAKERANEESISVDLHIL